MQEQHASSTLELVVNEQQMQNISQIDLRLPADSNQKATTGVNSYLMQSANAQQHQAQGNDAFSFEELRNWPTRFRDNLQLKLEEAKARSNTRTEYTVEIIRAFSGMFVWTLCFLCTIIFPIIGFVIGLANLDDCKDRPALPYIVLGIGFIMTASNLFNLALALNIPVLTNHKLLSEDVKNIIASILNIIFNCVVAFLYIMSAYMVYNIRGGVDMEAGDIELQCSKTLYNFTYWFITFTLSALVVLSLLALLLYIYNRYRLAVIRGSTPRSQQTTNSSPKNNNNCPI